MSCSYKLKRNCSKCHARIADFNQSGYCNSHRDRTGKNNSFFGKKHKQESIDNIKKKNSIKSKELWKNAEYREKVIRFSSKPRKPSFGEEQSKRVKEWYKNNPQQKENRSIKMKDSWKRGLITKNGYSCNSSKLEKDLLQEIKKITSDAKGKQTIRDDKNRWLFPDILIESWGIIIEFYGDYWHANPKKYKEHDIVRNNQSAKKIWDANTIRLNKFKNIPDKQFMKEYEVIVVWESDYLQNKEAVLKNINEIFNYEYSH